MTGQPSDQDAKRFILRLGQVLSAHGTPAHRVELLMTVCATDLGLTGQFFSLPTALNASFGDGVDGTTHLLRVEPGEVNLEGLVLLDEVFNDVVAHRITPTEGLARIEEIVTRPARFGTITVASCFSLVSAAACRILGGDGAEVVSALVIGAGVGVICLLMGRQATSARLQDFLCGLFAAFGSATIGAMVYPIRTDLVMLAGLIVMIPGLTLTMAINELSTRNLVAGTARFMGAMTIFVSLGFGVAVGWRAGAALSPTVATPSPLPGWTEALALLVAAISFTVLFKARGRDLPALLGAGVVGYYGARLGAEWLGPELGVSLAALLVGAFSNVYARFLDRPAAVALLPGILMLVPGSLGFRGVSSFIRHDAVSGMEATFDMLMIAVGLVVGLLIANVAVPSRKVL